MVSSEGKLSAPWVLPHKGRESLGFAARIATWTPESLSHVDLLHFLPSTSGTLSVTMLHPSTSPVLHWHPPSFNYAPLNHVRLFGIALIPETQRSADSTLSVPCREGKLCWTSHRHDSLWYAYPLYPSIGAHPACSPYYLGAVITLFSQCIGVLPYPATAPIPPGGALSVHSSPTP